ncbi:MAG: acyl carrier protein [Halobacteriovoraceae bacterium]|nr:acyl carrier protein [Halobacteriovoraceae bacterium]MCB9093550.1 acyl carrier protein [Halobacteriovoraceae bacterium]
MLETEQVKKEIINIIADIAPDENLDSLDGAKSLRDQLDLDSMDFLDIVMELRKRHQIEVPQEDYPKLATLDGCVEYLSPKFQ